MKVNKNLLQGHLRVINANGTIPDALVRDNFACTALDEESGFMVHTEGHTGLESLEDEVGILDMSMVISALNKFPVGFIDLKFESDRLILTCEDVGFNLLTCSPDYVSTNQNQDYFDKILKFVDDNKKCSFNITHDFVDKYKGVYSIIGSDETYINVSPEGSQFVVGHHSQNEATIEVDDLVSDEPFTVKVSSDILSTAMNVLVGEEMGFTGEDSILEISSEFYRYIISPIS